jgi:hypothetical protein
MRETYKMNRRAACLRSHSQLSSIREGPPSMRNSRTQNVLTEDPLLPGSRGYSKEHSSSKKGGNFFSQWYISVLKWIWKSVHKEKNRHVNTRSKLHGCGQFSNPGCDISKKSSIIYVGQRNSGFPRMRTALFLISLGSVPSLQAETTSRNLFFIFLSPNRFWFQYQFIKIAKSQWAPGLTQTMSEGYFTFLLSFLFYREKRMEFLCFKQKASEHLA